MNLSKTLAAEPSGREISPEASASPAHNPSSERVIILEAGQAEKNYWMDLWHYRELFAILAWRDIAVRYKQTAIGVAWAVVRPFLTMIIFTIIFGRVAQLPSDGAVPYPILVFAGMLPWFLFSTILGEASNSLVSNSHLVGKVYFPRLIIPGATAAVALVDFSVNVGILFAVMAWYGFSPGWQAGFLPIFTLLAILASLGPALLLTSLNVKYRDFRFVVPFIVQFGLYISPVGFSSSVIPDKWRIIYNLNPVVAVIDGFRWCLLGGQSPLNWPGLMEGFTVSAAFLLLGLAYFRKTEKTFADLI